MDWKAGEREFLIHLALNGPADQKRIAEAHGIVTPTINLAKDSLIERGYILLKGKEIRGRGAPRKIYALTPAGIVAAVLEGELLSNVGWVMELWGDIAPVFIRRYETLEEWGFDRDVMDFCESTLVKNKMLIEALGIGAHQLTCYMPSKDVIMFTTERDIEGYDLIDPWKGLLWIIDRGFYTEMYRSHGESARMRYLQMVKGDQVLREGWLRWFEGEQERFRKLNKHLKIVLNDQSDDDEKERPI